ncbi:UNVERIFIED_CONTAM: hypothetical protein Cloal_4462 [Acetivibrio alkalicellulosi]
MIYFSTKTYIFSYLASASISNEFIVAKYSEPILDEVKKYWKEEIKFLTKSL